jgi:hypothetical protein
MENQDMQQITEFLLYGTGPKDLLDRWKARQEEMAALREEREADPKAWEEGVAAMRSRRITVRPEEMSADTKARLEEIAAMTDKIWAARREMRKASRKEIVAENKPRIDIKTLAYRETTEARQDEEKPASADKKPEAAEEYEVPAENATLMPVGEPKKKRRRDRKLAAERRRQEPKDTKMINDGPQEKLAVARRGTTRRAKVARKTPIDRKMSCCATVARRKRDILKSHLTQEKCHPRRELLASRTRTTHRAKVARRKENSIGRDRRRDKMMLGTSKGWALGRDNGRNHNVTRGTRNEMTGHETAKRIIEPPVPSQNIENRTPWRGRPPPKRKNGNGLYGRNRWYKYRPP